MNYFETLIKIQNKQEQDKSKEKEVPKETSYILNAKMEMSRLPKEEEIALINRYKRGDEKAKEAIVLSNIGFVKYILDKYMVDYSIDVFQAGLLGLIKALDKFSIEKQAAKQTRFTTYASYRILQAAFKEIFEYRGAYKIPLYLINVMNDFTKIELEFLESKNRMPSEQELAELYAEKKRITVDLAKEKLISIRNACNTYLKTYVTDEDEIEEEEFIKDPNDIIDNTETSIQYEFILNNLENFLSEHEVKIIKMRYGIGYPKLNQEEIANGIMDIIGKKLTRERIRQLIENIEAKMRRYYMLLFLDSKDVQERADNFYKNICPWKKFSIADYKKNEVVVANIKLLRKQEEEALQEKRERMRQRVEKILATKRKNKEKRESKQKGKQEKKRLKTTSKKSKKAT